MPTAKAPPTRTLHRKLAQIMFEAERIPKNGTAPQVMGGYKFVQVGDAADYIRKALAEHVLTMMPTKVTVVGQVDRPTAKGGTMTTVDLLVEWTITDGESGETHVIESFGAGADGGDKYSGKASTSAMKYALLSGFLLSTGEDTELGTAEAGRSDAQPQRVQPGERASTHEDGLIGTVEARQEWLGDMEMRQSPEGMLIGFRLKEGRRTIKVVAKSPLTETLQAFRDEVIGATVTCWGTLVGEEFTPSGARRKVQYQVLHLERIRGPFGEFPAVSVPLEPSGEPVAPGQETLALDADERAAIAAGLPE